MSWSSDMRISGNDQRNIKIIEIANEKIECQFNRDVAVGETQQFTAKHEKFDLIIFRSKIEVLSSF